MFMSFLNLTQDSLFKLKIRLEKDAGTPQFHNLPRRRFETVGLLSGLDQHVYLHMIASNSLHQILMRRDAHKDLEGSGRRPETEYHRQKERRGYGTES